MSLGKLTETAMDVSDAFVKLREQIVLCRDSNSLQNGTTASVGGGAAAGLNIVQTTNLSFFDDKQKGELFRLKATFFALLKHNNQANQAFCHAVQICPNYGKAWLSWGEYLMGLSNSMHKKVLAAGNDKSTVSCYCILMYHISFCLYPYEYSYIRFSAQIFSCSNRSQRRSRRSLCNI